MSSILRFIGVANAALWFGAVLFSTLVVGPAFFSDRMMEMFAVGSGSEMARLRAGSAAQIVWERYYLLQTVCAVIALAQLVLESRWLNHALARRTMALVLGLLLVGSWIRFGVQPRLQQLQRERYGMVAGAAAASADRNRRAFTAWHGVAQAVNLAMLAGTALLLWRVQKPVEPPRFLKLPRFHLE